MMLIKQQSIYQDIRPWTSSNRMNTLHVAAVTLCSDFMQPLLKRHRYKSWQYYYFMQCCMYYCVVYNNCSCAVWVMHCPVEKFVKFFACLSDTAFMVHPFANACNLTVVHRRTTAFSSSMLYSSNLWGILWAISSHFDRTDLVSMTWAIKLSEKLTS